jgi:hypothetical protein
MAEKRLSNSEQQLKRIEALEAERDAPEGILEIFPRDADEPLSRDAADDE